jgi:AcrR family transcriptional regulator
MVKKDTTEEIILKAAEAEFVEKGLQGARMQTIADRAGINKSLLHYYYRSKFKLFEIILSSTLKYFIPNILKIFEDENLSFEVKIRNFVANYIDLLIKNPQIPIFILHELSTNPKGLANMANKLNVNVSVIVKVINQAIEDKIIREINPYQLIINTVSLCVFPFAAKPMIENVVLKDRDIEYLKIMEDRKTHIADFILNSIKL